MIPVSDGLYDKRFPCGQAKQRQERSQQVIEHHAEAAAQCSIVISDRRRFDYIEQTEKQKCGCLPSQVMGRKKQYQQKSGYLVPDHTPMIVITECLSGNAASPDSNDK